MALDYLPIDDVVKKRSETTYPEEDLLCIDQAVELSIRQGLSGAVLLLMVDGDIVFEKAYGHKNLWDRYNRIASPDPTTVDTIYDIASLTKVYATMQICMKLFDDKQLDLNEKVCHYVPEFSGGNKNDVTVKMLLQHRSGLPASYHFYHPDLSRGFFSQDRETSMSFLPLVPLINHPNSTTVYSDVGLCILGLIVERITQTREDIFIENELYKKLSLKRTGYLLKQKLNLPDNHFAATEPCGNTRDGTILFPNIRTNTIQGEVQDETSFYSFNGVSGSAGLFSCAEDLAILSQMMLNGGQYGDFRWCSDKTVSHFMETKNADETFSLLWRKTKPYEMTTGVIPKPHAVCHTGWVGTFSLLDQKSNSAIIYLSNKKNSRVLHHPNIFCGDCVVASTYGIIADMFYKGLIKIGKARIS
ncbi:serine hydrolase [Candidatus Ichthyocystis hellenicum]|uniref:serine hydrolase n=1 Tax=Candidatus Ichthyocystis hellenicum TaxID=1561003 RepID=UPI000A80FD13|nr:serine hydrolase [Candidatus Ichthyocystis hellenicum]